VEPASLPVQRFFILDLRLMLLLLVIIIIIFHREANSRMSLFASLKDLLKYSEPKNRNDFELLENSDESSSRQKQGEASFDRIGQSNASTTEKDKKPTRDNILQELEANIERMSSEFHMPVNTDIIIRRFKISRSINACILFIDGMVDKKTINDFILKPLMLSEILSDLKDNCLTDHIADDIITVTHIIREKEYSKVIGHVLSGYTAIFIDGCEECLVVENQGFEKRNVDKPITENVIRGSQEGFNESLRTNITLLRKIVRNKNLVTEIIHIDKTANTNCALLYIDGIANQTVIKEVKRRLAGLNTAYISGSGMLEGLISDHTLMPFPQIMTTERPDRAASYIMDGKVILIVDGIPFVSSIPTSFFETIQSPEDFSLKWQFASFLRYIRMTALYITLLLPGLYVAITTYHQEMIPTELLNSIVKSRENVPFPTIVEIILLETAFELIREGGIRTPGALGNTLGIVGALILGQAAVQAQLVSPVLIIVVAITGISGFAIPSYSMSFTIRLLRFVFIFFAAIAGFWGISVAIVIVLGLACSLRSFGVPYLVPIAPKTKANVDVISLFPPYKQKLRPDYINSPNKYESGKTTEEWIEGKEKDNK
ncbi:MAG: spore germination protein, partial [Pseudomonadota bacterium]